MTETEYNFQKTESSIILEILAIELRDFKLSYKIKLSLESCFLSRSNFRQNLKSRDREKHV